MRRLLREWAPMILVIAGMLLFGGRVLSLPAQAPPQAPQVAQLAQYPPQQQNQPYSEPSANSEPTATTDPASSQATQDPLTLTPTSDLPTADPALQPTITPLEQFPTEPLPAETPIPTPTDPLPPTPTITPEGETIACQPGTVAEVMGRGTPDAKLLVFLQLPADAIPAGSGVVFRSSGLPQASGEAGVFSSGDVPPPVDPGIPPPGPPSTGGAVGRVVGSGFVDLGGSFRLALAIETIKSGRYPLEVRDRGTQALLARYTCQVGGPAPTPLAITPQTTPAPNPGSQVFCGSGYLLQLTGQGAPRSPLQVSFDGSFIAGGTVLDDGTYNIPLTFGQNRPGTYRVEVSERGSRRILTRFLCLVPVTPTITPRNDRP